MLFLSKADVQILVQSFKALPQHCEVDCGTDISSFQTWGSKNIISSYTDRTRIYYPVICLPREKEIMAQLVSSGETKSSFIWKPQGKPEDPIGNTESAKLVSNFRILQGTGCLQFIFVTMGIPDGAVNKDHTLSRISDIQEFYNSGWSGMCYLLQRRMVSSSLSYLRISVHSDASLSPPTHTYHCCLGYPSFPLRMVSLERTYSKRNS